MDKSRIDHIVRLRAASNFLDSFLNKHPTVLTELQQAALRTSTEEILLKINQVSERDALLWRKQILYLKYTALSLIMLRDQEGEAQEYILEDLSALALAIIRSADSLVYHELVKKLGEPLNASEQASAYHVVTLGKLGARELNLSSDIDLMMIYDGVQAEGANVSVQEFFCRYVTRFSQLLTQNDEDGFLYRVDWDLRPEGKSGMRAHSILALESYHETQAQAWERQAMLRANLGAGDEAFGLRILQSLKNYSLRSQFEFSALDQMESLRERLNQKTKFRDLEFDVKLSYGGIRDVEFFVQALQLVYAPTYPQLLLKNTFELLIALHQCKIITHKQKQDLHYAYSFLRRLENHIQLEHEAQSQALTQNRNARLRLARSLGFNSQDDAELLHRLQKSIAEARAIAREKFETLFSNQSQQGYQEDDWIYLFSEVDYLQVKALCRDQNDVDLSKKMDALFEFRRKSIHQIQSWEKRASIYRRRILISLSGLARMILEEVILLAQHELNQKLGPRSTSIKL